MKNFKKISGVCILGIVLVCFGLITKNLVSAKVVSKGTVVDEKSLKGKNEQKKGAELKDSGEQKEKPLAVKEWGKVWGDLWLNEGKELKKEGLSENEIITKLNPVAAERVSKNLNMDKAVIEKIVNDYYNSLKEAESNK